MTTQHSPQLVCSVVNASNNELSVITQVFNLYSITTVEHLDGKKDMQCDNMKYETDISASCHLTLTSVKETPLRLYILC